MFARPSDEKEGTEAQWERLLSTPGSASPAPAPSPWKPPPWQPAPARAMFARPSNEKEGTEAQWERLLSAAGSASPAPAPSPWQSPPSQPAPAAPAPRVLQADSVQRRQGPRPPCSSDSPAHTDKITGGGDGPSMAPTIVLREVEVQLPASKHTLRGIRYSAGGAGLPESGGRWLLLHGWLDNAGSFDRLVPLLFEKGLAHDVTALDMSGEARSYDYNLSSTAYGL